MVKRYGPVTAVDGLTLSAKRGAVTAILGPNGAGKTTTIEACEGYRAVDGGTVRVLGLDPVRDATALRPRVGVMLQEGGIPPAVPAGEYLRTLSRFHVKPHDAAWLLDIVGLTSHAKTPYKRLSGGQQQRLSLAAAVLGRPELVFLDEPTAGMDPQARHATWDLVTALKRDGVAVILTTHFMEEAERLADHVVIIDHGRRRRQGVPGRPLPDRGARPVRPARAAGRRHRLVRGPRRAAKHASYRVAHARRHLPRAHRPGAAVMTTEASTAIAASRFTPEPGAAPLRRMVAAQAAQETRQLLRNGEQLTLTLIIPLLLLAAFSLEPLISFGGGYTRIDFLTPGVIALAVMSTAFTSQAIATGFERRYGVLKRLGATPLSRTGLIAAKTATVIAVELIQAVIILLVALALGWSPNASPAAVITVPLLVLLGTAAFSGFALLLAGTLRAEATLATANLIYVILLGIGGVVFPLTKFPAGARPVLELLPTGALSTGLRDILANASVFPAKEAVALAVWAVLSITLATRFFRWE